MSLEEKICEINFEQTTKRNESGKSVVTISLKKAASAVGESQNVAIKRFYALEKRLEKKPAVKKMYLEFIKEYLNLGHMTEIINKSSEPEYYFPRHHVLRESSSTTKLGTMAH